MSNTTLDYLRDPFYARMMAFPLPRSIIVAYSILVERFAEGIVDATTSQDTATATDCDSVLEKSLSADDSGYDPSNADSERQVNRNDAGKTTATENMGDDALTEPQQLREATTILRPNGAVSRQDMVPG
ncbi:hypothetical protein NKR23_g5717 [Pleurostoma richardsiae]|uniref:Uncharacterized protein n=1 Tax=Pleurostoma richardsiae TaxID=41990 RepID=A0AA38RD21_9PEZI|nr:hypothetical protein NKR23_g5717 [Pleurostoma richardsiae]